MDFWFVRILAVWCGIALVIFLMQISVCGIVHDNENVRTFLKFLELLPSIVKTLLGGESLQAGNTAALITIGYQHPLVLVLYMLFAVGVPTGLLAGKCRVRARPTGFLRVRCNGKPIRTSSPDKNVIQFQTDAGAKYFISIEGCMW